MMPKHVGAVWDCVCIRGGAFSGVMNEMFSAVKLQAINNSTKCTFDDGWPIRDPQQWTQTVHLLSCWVREISALQRDSSHRWYNLPEAA